MSFNDYHKRRDWRVCRCGQAFDVPLSSTASRCGGCMVKHFFKVCLYLGTVAAAVLWALAEAGAL